MEGQDLDTKPIREYLEKDKSYLGELLSQSIDAEIALARRGIVIPYPPYSKMQININERKG